MKRILIAFIPIAVLVAVLASSINGVDLFRHIRYMMFTTVPSFVITITVFLILGLSHEGADSGLMETYSNVLQGRFNLTPWLMLVPLLTVLMIWRRLPALAVLALSTLAAAVVALIGWKIERK